MKKNEEKVFKITNYNCNDEVIDLNNYTLPAGHVAYEVLLNILQKNNVLEKWKQPTI